MTVPTAGRPAPGRPVTAGPVIAGADGSPASDQAVRWAAADAARLGLALRIVHVAPPARTFHGRPPLGPGRVRGGAARRVLRDACAIARRDHPGLHVEVRLAHDRNAAAGLLGHAAEAYEVVIGHRGLGGLPGLLLGSTGLRLAGHVPCAVVVVRGREDASYREVAAGLPLEGDPTAVLEHAFTAASARGARLRAVHAWRPARTAVESGVDLNAVQRACRDRLAAMLAPWTDRHPDVEVITDPLMGHPAGILVEVSSHADLVVVGARRRTGPHLGSVGRLGSVGHGLVHHAHCPVAVVQPG
ncbi:universal stress protein [Actinomadura viridis]|uniref:universal stress protein n=1 Tax=Actinomadura viridis TaxID=58110 RepID=UPI00369E0CD1